MESTIADAQTTQQLITEILRRRPSARPIDLKKALNDQGIRLSVDEVIEFIHEIKETLDDPEQVFVAPPVCRNCGFDDWDEPANIPSQCPDCRSEYIQAPEFTIRGPET